jgi:glycosyltransferase involved in cell wall biosynthesis
MISLIVPVYNEEEIIIQNTKKLIDFLDGLKRPYEIIICNNGSTDSTVEKGKSLQEDFPSKVRFFSIPEKGVGLAFKKAVVEANYNYLISIDIDLTTDIKFIQEALELFEEYDIIIGSKKVGEQQRSKFRLFVSGGFIFLVKHLLGLNYTDYSIGTKAYKKDVIEHWISEIDHGSSYVIELVYHAKKEGHKIIEIPVFCDDRRKSRFNLSYEIFYRFKNLLILWFSVNNYRGNKGQESK